MIALNSMALSSPIWCYFLTSLSDIQNIDRYWSKAYTPSDADILHCSTPTFETTEISYRVNDLQYHVFDVGIRPGERMKVINHFAMASGSHCMIYTVPLSCYDRCSIFEKPIVCCTALQRINPADPSTEHNTRISSIRGSFLC